MESDPPSPKNKKRSRFGLRWEEANRVDRLDDRDAAVRLVVLHGAVLQCEERPIAADADVFAGVGFAAALADDDRAREDGLTTVFLYAEPLRFAGAAVGRGTLTCFMRHGGWVSLKGFRR